jgi:hypothetical protein
VPASGGLLYRQATRGMSISKPRLFRVVLSSFRETCSSSAGAWLGKWPVLTSTSNESDPGLQ